jgi:hypothetical protein
MTMNGKKLVLIAVSAIAAALLAAPAGASALMLNYKGAGIPEPIPFELEGSINFTTAKGNGMDCVARTTMTAETADAKVTGVHITTATCVGTGATTKCLVKGETMTKLPWTADVWGSGFYYTDVTIDYNLECLFGPVVSLSVEKLTGTVDSTSAIKKVTLSGTGVAGGETATVSGVFTILGETAGAFSIVE